jgi:hypothetical protein
MLQFSPRTEVVAELQAHTVRASRLRVRESPLAGTFGSRRVPTSGGVMNTELCPVESDEEEDDEIQEEEVIVVLGTTPIDRSFIDEMGRNGG